MCTTQNINRYSGDVAPQLVAYKLTEDEMKKGTYQLLFVSLFIFMLAPIAAFAQIDSSSSLSADIPFEFQAGQSKFPAGDYTITPVDDRDPYTLIIRKVDGGAEAMVSAEPINTPGNMTPSQSSLDFDKVAGKDVLTEIWVAGTDQGYRVEEPKPVPAVGGAHARRMHHSVLAHKTSK